MADPSLINAWLRLGFTPAQAAGLSLDSADIAYAAELREATYGGNTQPSDLLT